MKKIFKIFSILALTSLLFSCADGLSESENKTSQFSRGAIDSSLPKVEEGYLRINYLGKTATDLWIWDDFDKSEIEKCSSWTSSGVLKTGTNGDFVYFDVKLSSSPALVSFIVRSEPSDAGKLTGNMTFLFPSKYPEIFVNT